MTDVPRLGVSGFDVPLTPNEEAALDAELAATEAQFGDELAQLLRVPADLQRRTVVEVNAGLLARSSLSTAVDLVGLGWRTIRLLATSPEDEPATTEEVAP